MQLHSRLIRQDRNVCLREQAIYQQKSNLKYSWNLKKNLHTGGAEEEEGEEEEEEEDKNENEDEDQTSIP